MLEVNNINLRKEIEQLSTLINEYEEIQLNMFNQLKDSSINWQDGNSIEFENKIYLEKQESNSLLQCLKDKKEILEFIFDKYSEMGKKIKCNLNNKSTVINSILNCQSQINNILNDFNKIDTSFYYSEKNLILKQKQNLLNVKKELLAVKKSIEKNYQKIEEIEKEIKSKINTLVDIKINDFDYNLI